VGYQPVDLKFAKCLKENSTYLDCPISNYTFGWDAPNATVVVHNPSTAVAHLVHFPVPNGHFDVELFDKSAKKFKLINDKIDVFCRSDTTFDDAGNLKFLENCELYAALDVSPWDLQILSITPNPETDHERPVEVISNKNNVIESGSLKAVFSSADKAEQILNFEVFKNGGKVGSFDFGLKNWHPF